MSLLLLLAGLSKPFGGPRFLRELRANLGELFAPDIPEIYITPPRPNGQGVRVYTLVCVIGFALHKSAVIQQAARKQVIRDSLAGRFKVAFAPLTIPFCLLSAASWVTCLAVNPHVLTSLRCLF
jgi:hypothetical protein